MSSFLKNNKEGKNMKASRILALVLALVMVLALVPTAVAEDAPMTISVAGYMFGPLDNEKDVTGTRRIRL